MLPPSQQRILERLAEDQLVLDVGGWASPFPRADWVLDLMPFEARAPYAWSERAAQERFSAETWVQRDICDKEPYPFEDGQFDFVVCSQTLEDVRDPIWVCSEMQRIARAGYIEVPSRLVEQAWGVEGPWVGYSHHRWLIDVGPGRISFVSKPHMVHRKGDHFPGGFIDSLEPGVLDTMLWWEGGFECEERFFDAPEELDAYVGEFVTRELVQRGGLRARLRRRLSRR